MVEGATEEVMTAKVNTGKKVNAAKRSLKLL